MLDERAILLSPCMRLFLLSSIPNLSTIHCVVCPREFLIQEKNFPRTRFNTKKRKREKGKILESKDGKLEERRFRIS